MPSTDIQVSVENQQLKLSNLDKILFAKTGIIKAELIQYYQQVATYMLPFVQNRPLTLIRYPDGVGGTKFYSKNKAEWTPSWIASAKLPDNQEIDYILANNTATLVWLANLAAIELHAMTLTTTNYKSNQIIFDLDPPEGIVFDEIKNIAEKLKIYLLGIGYQPYLKTSGGKGLHIYVPILPENDTEIVVEHARDLAKNFITNNPNTTLALNKERRGNKVLIDIFRNHRSQTCAAAFSVRGHETAPVSMPLPWAQLGTLHSSQQYTLRNAIDYLAQNGNAWADFEKGSTKLFLKNKIIATNSQTIDNKLLEQYEAKRDFTKTTEPSAVILPNNTGELRYVIQKHNASNLHYDLRLEYNGVLLSWAIPKALPESPGTKRMAIETEPHPMKYLDFEGVIPANEYGGGEMWVFDTGTFEFLKKEENKISFVLKGGKITGEFHIFRTKDNQWLIEKKEANTTIEGQNVSPMLAELASQIPNNHIFEIKWD